MLKKIISSFILLLAISGCKDSSLKTEAAYVKKDDPERIIYYLGGDIEYNGSIYYVNAFIPENILNDFHRDMKVMIRVSGNNPKLLHGKISMINSDIDAKSKTALADVAILDSFPGLRHGMVVLIGLEENKIRAQ